MDRFPFFHWGQVELQKIDMYNGKATSRFNRSTLSSGNGSAFFFMYKDILYMYNIYIYKSCTWKNMYIWKYKHIEILIDTVVHPILSARKDWNLHKSLRSEFVVLAYSRHHSWHLSWKRSLLIVAAPCGCSRSSACEQMAICFMWWTLGSAFCLCWSDSWRTVRRSNTSWRTVRRSNTWLQAKLVYSLGDLCGNMWRNEVSRRRSWKNEAKIQQK